MKYWLVLFGFLNSSCATVAVQKSEIWVDPLFEELSEEILKPLQEAQLRQEQTYFLFEQQKIKQSILEKDETWLQQRLLEVLKDDHLGLVAKKKCVHLLEEKLKVLTADLAVERIRHNQLQSAIARVNSESDLVGFDLIEHYQLKNTQSITGKNLKKRIQRFTAEENRWQQQHKSSKVDRHKARQAFWEISQEADPQAMHCAGGYQMVAIIDNEEDHDF